MHRDLKPENMVVKDGSLAICDLGTAKVVEHSHAAVDFEEIANPAHTWDTTHGVATLPYAAPEMLEYKPYGLPVDLWAIGCIDAANHQTLRSKSKVVHHTFKHASGQASHHGAHLSTRPGIPLQFSRIIDSRIRSLTVGMNLTSEGQPGR